jgi:hypothetical protein
MLSKVVKFPSQVVVLVIPKVVVRFDCSGVLFVPGNTWLLSAVVYSASSSLVL